MDGYSDNFSKDVLYIVPRALRSYSELFIDSTQIDITREPVLIMHYGTVDDYLRIHDDIIIKINSNITSISAFTQVCKQINRIATGDLPMNNIDLADVREFSHSCNEFYGFDSESEAKEFSQKNSVKSVMILPIGEYDQNEYWSIIERFRTYNKNVEYFFATPMFELGSDVGVISILGI